MLYCDKGEERLALPQGAVLAGSPRRADILLDCSTSSAR
jgi:hypothetical protein